MKVATYSRVSTQHRDQKPEVQVQELRRYCKARKFKIAHEIVDRAIGGTDDRPGLKRTTPGPGASSRGGCRGGREVGSALPVAQTPGEYAFRV
jgi:hypothetical protein